MSGDLTICQRKLGHARAFQFAGENLIYTIRDPSGAERTFSVPYQIIDAKNVSSVRSKNPLFMRTLIRIAVVGLLVAFAVTTVNRQVGAIIGVASVCAYVAIWAADFTGLLSVSFANLPMAPVPPGANSNLLSIIADESRDRIVDELTQRWRERVRALCGVVNPNGEPEKEAARMQWLKDRGVISESEYVEQLGRLRALSSSDRASEAVRLN